MTERICEWTGLGVDVIGLVEEGASPMECVLKLKSRKREEVVRCRDCERLAEDGGKLLCSATMCYVPPDGYCWMGKHHTRTYVR